MRTGLVGVAALVPALTLFAGPAHATGTTTAARNSVTRCHNSQLAVRLGRPEGTAGSVYVRIGFKNTSGSRCTLDGHPGVSFVTGDDGHQVGLSAGRAKSSRPKKISIAPGHRASAVLRITDEGGYARRDCRPVHARGLRVYPPDSYHAVYLPDPQPACSSRAVRQLTIRSVRHH
ncbi:MAG: DUF4232 domain-containing protein [Streptosporangiales bacterium]